MKLKFYSPAIVLLLLFSFSGVGLLEAQSPNENREDPQSLQTILHLDSLFWEAYNNCQIDKFQDFFTNDLEFYHDKGGITKSREKLLETTRNGLCGNEDWRLRRELVKGSLRLDPLHKNGELYGAILSGEHLFFVNEKDKKEYLDGIALFTHLWLLEEGVWKMSRVMSYDHRPASHNPNERSLSHTD